jgi:hypothetical protein
MHKGEKKAPGIYTKPSRKNQEEAEGEKSEECDTAGVEADGDMRGNGGFRFHAQSYLIVARRHLIGLPSPGCIKTLPLQTFQPYNPDSTPLQFVSAFAYHKIIRFCHPNEASPNRGIHKGIRARR